MITMRRLRHDPAKMLNRRQAIHSGQAHIEHDEIRRSATRKFQPLLGR